MGNSVAKPKTKDMGNVVRKRGGDDPTEAGSVDDNVSVAPSTCSRQSWGHSFYTMGGTKGDGSMQSMEGFHGKVIYAVNVASKCGLTNKEYKQFVQLNEKYGDKLVILGFPSRQFAWQEHKTDDAIAEFAKSKNFPGIMMQLGKVKGKEAPELWKFFKTETGAKSPKWNFQGKFLISKTGNVSVSNTKDLEADIERLIEEDYEEDLEYLEFIEAVTNVWR